MSENNKDKRAYFDCCNDTCVHGWIDPHQEMDRVTRIHEKNKEIFDTLQQQITMLQKCLDNTNKTYESRMLIKQHEYDLLAKELIILRASEK